MWQLLQQLSAPRWTVLCFLLMAAASLSVSEYQWPATYTLLPPFILLLLNLCAAIFTLPRFRRDLPLLIFHLALVLLITLFALARLTYFTGTISLSVGESFDGTLLTHERGPLHGDGVGQLQFINQGFYEEPSEYGEHFTYTRNRVRWLDEQGQWHSSVIGDDIPLLLGLYRIYTTSRRGFSPVFQWQSPDGSVELGSVQLNTIIDDETPPLNSWTLPNGVKAWAMLSAGDDIKTPFVMPANSQKGVNLNTSSLSHQLVLRIDEQRYALQPGQSLTHEGGTLTYLRLDSWMGYQIIYDPTQPWLIATVAVGVLCLLWFYARQLLGRGSWDSDR